MEEIGVQAVVSELNKFLGDMGKVDSSIQGLVPGGNLLKSVFQGLGDVTEWLANSALRILEYTLGSLLASAIQTAIRWIQELIQGTIEAGNEFQALSIRLQNFNMNDATKSISNYDIAMQVATKATQEQLTWLQRLAAQSPYDAADIANVYSLARSYGFADTESRGLTATIAEFASGMGLGNQEIERIIVNLGQMQQQGKVTQREMTDLARGALVPVNDVLALMQKQSGLTGKAFDDFRNSGEGVQAFMKAFSTLVEQRFSGSMEKMSRTWKGATDNLKDFVQSVIGLDVVKPILDVIGGHIADFLSSLSGEKLDQFTGLAKKVGESLSLIVSDILGLAPSADDLAGRLLQGLSDFSQWLRVHRQDIVDFVQNVVTRVGEFAASVSNFVQTVIIPAFNRISEWVSSNSGQIQEFFGALGEIISDVFSNLFGGVDTSGTDFLGTLLESVSKFMQFVIDNKEQIASWATVIIVVITALSILQTVISTIISIIVGFVSFVGSLVVVWVMLSNVINFLVPIFTALGSAIAAVGAFLATITLPVWGLIAAIIVLVALVVANWETLKTTTYQLAIIVTYYFALLWNNISKIFSQIVAFIISSATTAWNFLVTTFSNILNAATTWVASLLAAVIAGFARILSSIVSAMSGIYNTIINSFNNIRNSILSINWVSVGVGIVQGMISGIKSMVGSLVSAATSAAQAALSAVKGSLKISSPSKVMYDVGQNIMLGLADGIVATTGIVESAMRNSSFRVAASGLASSRVPASSISNISNANNYNLAIHTSSPVEPIISDFAMMQALSS